MINTRQLRRNPFTFYMPGRARKDIIKETCLAWIQKSPGEARLMAEYLKGVTKQQLRGGKWRRKDGGYLKVSVPADLFYSLRRLLPDFADDDKDLRYLAEEFPDLMGKFNG